MAENQETAEQPNQANGQKRQRKSAVRDVFPRVPIQKVIPLADAIWSEGRGEQVRATAAFNRLNRSHASGAGRTLIAAANTGYGLINGNATSAYFSLTPKGKAIVATEDPAERNALIHQALFANDIFSKIHERYKDKALPSDQVVSDVIKGEFGLSDEDSAACWVVISENMKDAGLLIKENNRDVVISPQPLPAGGSSDSIVKPPLIDQELDEPGTERLNPLKQEAAIISPHAEFHFNVQIHIPSDATPETYDAIFTSIAKNLMQRNG